jgi:hypothetical protein
MSRLPELLKELGKHADEYEAYIKDPHGVMDRYGCTDEEKKAMIAKDIEAVKRLSGMDNLVSNQTIKAHER